MYSGIFSVSVEEEKFRSLMCHHPSILSFCLSQKIFISPSLLKDNFAGYIILDFFSFII